MQLTGLFQAFALGGKAGWWPAGSGRENGEVKEPVCTVFIVICMTLRRVWHPCNCNVSKYFVRFISIARCVWASLPARCVSTLSNEMIIIPFEEPLMKTTIFKELLHSLLTSKGFQFHIQIYFHSDNEEKLVLWVEEVTFFCIYFWSIGLPGVRSTWILHWENLYLT